MEPTYYTETPVMNDNETIDTNPVDPEKFVDDFIKKVVELTVETTDTPEDNQ